MPSNHTQWRYFCRTPYNVKVSGASVSADVKAGEEFLETIDKLIVEKNYLPGQIFNISETSLFWKWVPERTLVHKGASQCQVSRF